MTNLLSVDSVDHLLTRTLKKLENFCFRFRTPFLIWLAVFTAVMGYFALQLRMEAGFEKQMPTGHEYIETFNEYPLWEMMSKNPMRIDFISGEKKFTEKTQTDN